MLIIDELEPGETRITSKGYSRLRIFNRLTNLPSNAEFPTTLIDLNTHYKS